jgi:hypothetical protein
MLCLTRAAKWLKTKGVEYDERIHEGNQNYGCNGYDA